MYDHFLLVMNIYIHIPIVLLSNYNDCFFLLLQEIICLLTESLENLQYESEDQPEGRLFTLGLKQLEDFKIFFKEIVPDLRFWSSSPNLAINMYIQTPCTNKCNWINSNLKFLIRPSYLPPAAMVSIVILFLRRFKSQTTWNSKPE